MHDVCKPSSISCRISTAPEPRPSPAPRAPCARSAASPSARLRAVVPRPLGPSRSGRAPPSRASPSHAPPSRAPLSVSFCHRPRAPRVRVLRAAPHAPLYAGAHASCLLPPRWGPPYRHHDSLRRSPHGEARGSHQWRPPAACSHDAVPPDTPKCWRYARSSSFDRLGGRCAPFRRRFVDNPAARCGLTSTPSPPSRPMRDLASVTLKIIGCGPRHLNYFLELIYFNSM